MAVCFNDAVIHLLHRSLAHLESTFSAIMHTMLRDNLEYTGVSGSWKDPELCLTGSSAVQYSTLLNAKVLLTQQSLALSLTGLQGLQRTDQGLFNKQKKVLNSPYPEETSAPRNKDLCLHYFDLSIISVLRMCYITVLW